MKSLMNVVCGLGLFALIASPVLANEPTAPAGTDTSAAADSAHPTEAKTAKATKKSKKSKKTTTTTTTTESTTTAPAGEAHPTGN